MFTQLFAILLTAAFAALYGTAPVESLTTALFFLATTLSVAVLLTLKKSSWEKEWQRIVVTFTFPYMWTFVTGILIADNTHIAFKAIALVMSCAGIWVFYKKAKK